MTFRLRHRATFDPLSVIHSLDLRPPRLTAPEQWHWSWPLHRPSPTEAPQSRSPVRNVWVSAIQAVAVCDDASALAFVSHIGTVALALRTSQPSLSACTDVSVGSQVDSHVAEWCTDAVSVAFFSLSSQPAVPPTNFLAVGYQSGAIAIFDVPSAALVTVTRPHNAPVRRLRFYPAFQVLPTVEPYPVATTNSGLLAVFGSSGIVARLSSIDLLPLLTDPPTIDPGAARWVLWNLSAQEIVLDAAACGSDPSSICDLDVAPPSAALRIAATGVNPPIAAYSVTSDPAFSARAVAKRAATNVLSAARGFLFSRIATVEQDPPSILREPSAPVNGVARLCQSWADDPASVHGVINFGDVRDTARKSVSAVLQRGRRFSTGDSDATLEPSQSRNSMKGPAMPLRNSLENPGDLNRLLNRNGETYSAALFKRRLATRRNVSSKENSGQPVANLPQNTRLVERLAAAPLPCTLFATCDSLGRIFIQDARDMCVLRVLKGYRDADVAWLAEGGPMLVVHAPRLNVIEVHEALEQKRKEAFQLPPGSMIAQGTLHRVFSLSADGHLYELGPSKKTETKSSDLHHGTTDESASTAGENMSSAENQRASQGVAMVRTDIPADGHDMTAPDYELIGSFTEAIKKGHTSQAIDCMQRVQKDVYQAAHLMATLVTCTTFASTDMHVALSSAASEIAENLKNADLSSRFDAHRKLAEAFDLLASDALLMDVSNSSVQKTKHAQRRLLDDDLGDGLDIFATTETTLSSKAPAPGKRMKRSQADTELINCERFILSHSLAPNLDVHTNTDYKLQPRSDLSTEEEVWLAKAYFMRLLDPNAIETATPGREHPTTADIFVALTNYIGLSEADITRFFVLFFLHTPLVHLLNTYASPHASPLRCALARLQSKFSKDVVDPILLDGCETTSRIPNAVLLTRLCAVYENDSTSQETINPFFESLDRLGEVLLFRKMIAESDISAQVYEKFTARRCTGVPGDAERHAVSCLLGANDFERASKVLTGLEVSKKLQNLDWHESASVSEAALHACRKKALDLIDEDSGNVLPSSVLSWILATDGISAEGRVSTPKSDTLATMQGIRMILLSAHHHIPDSSVDAVRCLQLAEAMSALIKLEKEKKSAVAPYASQDLADMDIGDAKESMLEPSALESGSKEAEESQPAQPGSKEFAEIEDEEEVIQKNKVSNPANAEDGDF